MYNKSKLDVLLSPLSSVQPDYSVLGLPNYASTLSMRNLNSISPFVASKAVPTLFMDGDDFASDASTTGTVSIGVSASGIIESEGDQDWFAFDVEAGRQYTVNVFSDLNFRIVSADGTVIYDAVRPFIFSGWEVFFLAAETTTYYVEVDGPGPELMLPPETAYPFNYSVELTDGTLVTDAAADASTTESADLTAGERFVRLEAWHEDRQDVDWIALTVEAGQRYVFDTNDVFTGMTLDPLDFQFEIVDAAGNVLQNMDVREGQNSAGAEYLAATSDTVYLRVTALDQNADTGAAATNISQFYNITAAAIPGSEADDIGQDISSAMDFNASESFTARISHERDIDWFAVSLTSGERYQFDLDSPDTSMQIVRADGTVLSQYDPNGVGVQTLDFVADETGEFFVAVRYNSFTFPSPIPFTYELSRSTIEVPDPDNIPANDTTTATFVDGLATGVFTAGGDADWFRLDVTEGQTFELIIPAGQPVDGFSIINEDGTSLISGGVNTTAESVYTVYIDYTGTLFVSLTGSPEINSRYSVSGEIQTDDISNIVPGAAVIAVNETVSSRIDYVSDIDVFQIEIAEDGGYNFFLIRDGQTTANGFELVDADGQPAGDVYRVNNNPLLPNQGFVEAGTYYVRLSAGDQGAGDYNFVVRPITDNSATTYAAPQALNFGQITRYVSNFNGDIDYYSVAVGDDGLLRLDSAAVAGAGVGIQVFDANGDLIAPAFDTRFTAVNDIYLGFDAATNFYRTGPGEVTIAVQRFGRENLAPVTVDFVATAPVDHPLSDSVSNALGSDVILFRPVDFDAPTPTIAETVIALNLDIRTDIDPVTNEAVLIDESVYTLAEGEQLYGPGPFFLSQSDGVLTLDGDTWAYEGGLINGINWDLVTNNGDMVAISQGGGVAINSGAFITLHNFGTITVIARGSATGYQALSSSDVGVSDGINLNDGTLSVFSAEAAARGVGLFNPNNFTNNGEIIVESLGLAQGIFLADTGEVTNTGTITAITGSAFESSEGITALRSARIENSGTVNADFAVIMTELSNLNNSGTLNGDVLVFDPFPNTEISDGFFTEITNIGTISGNIFFTKTNDLYSGGGQVDGFIAMGAGDDRAFGGTGVDFIFGESGDDSLFGDNAPALLTDSLEGQLFRAYQAVFGRSPDAGGFNAFLTEMRLGNLAQVDVIGQFVASAEFQNSYGQLDNTEFVEQLFTNVLPGNQDAQGRANYVAVLEAGTLTRPDMVVELSNSPEFINRMAVPSAAFATNVILHPAEAQVFRIYQAVFLRDPDEGGFTAFTNSIQANVLSVEEITAEFVASTEFQDSYGALDNAAFVELLFTNVLPGNTDAAGRAAYTAALDAGTLTRAAMVAEFVESFEFVQRTATDADAFVAGVFTASGDTLVGGTGADILFGGRGADLFVYDTAADGADTILDFTVGTDTLDLGSNAAFDSFAEIIAAATQVGQDTVFDFGGGNTLTLDNTVLTDLTEAEFGFGAAGSSASSSAAAKPPTIPVMEVAEDSTNLDMLITREEPDWAIDALI